MDVSNLWSQFVRDKTKRWQSNVLEDTLIWIIATNSTSSWLIYIRWISSHQANRSTHLLQFVKVSIRTVCFLSSSSKGVFSCSSRLLAPKYFNMQPHYMLKALAGRIKVSWLIELAAYQETNFTVIVPAEIISEPVRVVLQRHWMLQPKLSVSVLFTLNCAAVKPVYTYFIQSN